MVTLEEAVADKTNEQIGIFMKEREAINKAIDDDPHNIHTSNRPGPMIKSLELKADLN